MARDVSPLTDVRALLGSAAFHALLFALASFAAFGVGAPTVPIAPRLLNAEIGPVDNRAPSEAGGGAPGEVGGMSDSVRISAEGRSNPGRPDLDAAARLLSDGPPAGEPPPDVAPIGPPTTGLGLISGEGSGGGGGTGGGSGGGIGKGIGPGTEFFGATERAASFAYVIDCSGSMSNKDALRIAKVELLSSLDRLPPDARFTVVFYNIRATAFPDEAGKASLMAATRENKDRVRARLSAIRPDGGTDHARALRAAFALKPEAVFFLTDAERLEGGEVQALRDEAGAIRIQAVEFGDGPSTGGASPLRDLATATGGAYRRIDLSEWQGVKPHIP